MSALIDPSDPVRRRCTPGLLVALVMLAIGGLGAVIPPPGTAGDRTPKVNITTAWSADKIRPGDRVLLAVVLQVAPGYHINADAAQLISGDAFKPVATRIDVLSTTDGLFLGPPLFPEADTTPVAFVGGGLKTFNGQTVVRLPVELSRPVDHKDAVVRLAVTYQACDAQNCFFPHTAPLTSRLPIGAVDDTVSATHSNLFNSRTPTPAHPPDTGVGFNLYGWHYTIDMGGVGGFALLLATAALGGLLLNLTPCVLPLIPIKINSLAQASQHRVRCFGLGVSVSLGVLVFWIGLGTALAFISGFSAASQLYHYPAFTIGVGIFIAVMAVGMGGLFSIQPPRFLYLIHPRSDTMPGAFVVGILTAVLSTPCSAPFMGAAAAWALSQTPLVTTVTFCAIGAGMAAPYLLLAAQPGWLRRLPRSGPMGQLVKEVMGLLLLAAAAYFVGTGISSLLTRPPNPPDPNYWWVVMGLIAAAGCWLAVRSWRLIPGRYFRTVALLLGIVLTAGSLLGAVRLTRSGPIDWVYYTPDAYQTARRQQQTLVMVFTAEWCLNCKALEQGVLHSPSIVSLLAREDVVPMKVDLTANHPVGRAKLKEMGATTIPLLVVISGDGHEIFRSDFYTVGQLQKVLAHLPD